MTVPRTLRTASQGQSMVCLSRRFQVSKHLSDGPLASSAPHPSTRTSVMAVLSYGLASFVRLTVLAITSKDGRFGALALSAHAGPGRRGPLGRAA